MSFENHDLPVKRPRIHPQAAVALIVIAGGVLVTFWATSRSKEYNNAEPMPVATAFVNLPVEEPSSAAYHAGRGTLLIISDQGELAELDLQYAVRERYKIPGDLEGVAVHPATGTVFIASESAGAILEFDLEARRVLRTIKVDFSSHKDFAAGLTWNKGLEGVAVVPVGEDQYTLYAVVEAYPARLLQLAADVSPEATENARQLLPSSGGVSQRVTIAATYDLGLKRLSDVSFDAPSKTLLVPSAGSHVLLILNLKCEVIRRIRLPGPKSEGFCFLPNGDAIVADDRGGGWICPKLHSALFP